MFIQPGESLADFWNRVKRVHSIVYASDHIEPLFEEFRELARSIEALDAFETVFGALANRAEVQAALCALENQLNLEEQEHSRRRGVSRQESIRDDEGPATGGAAGTSAGLDAIQEYINDLLRKQRSERIDFFWFSLARNLYLEKLEQSEDHHATRKFGDFRIQGPMS